MLQMLHVLRDCSKAKELWESVGISFINNSFFQQPLHLWLKNNMINETRMTQGIEWPLIFMTS